MNDRSLADWPAGSDVFVRGSRWTVLAATHSGDCTALRLAGSDLVNSGTRRTLLAPFDRPRRIGCTLALRTVSRRRWWRTIRRHLSTICPFGIPDACAGADLDIHPFQLAPAVAMLRHGNLRLFIADEVGLGKTVQAGIIVAQLQAADVEFRALVVCPAGLRGQWCDELQRRFALGATLADAAWLLRASRDLPPDVNPWGLPGIFVTSIDLVKRPEAMRSLEQVTWDLAVFDEAHALAPATARLTAAAALAERSRRIILLSATPPDGDPEHMAALDALGADATDNLMVFRRRRTDVGLGVRRRSVIHAVRITDLERAMHSALETYAAALWREGSAAGACRPLAILLIKRALSSARSVALSIRRRLALIARPSEWLMQQLVLPIADEDPTDDVVADALLGTAGLGDVGRERRLLSAIAAAADRAAEHESKLRYLTRFITRAREPVIVFTEYRDTLQQIAVALRRHSPLELHGGMSLSERARMQTEFCRRGGVLLATDAASEGLNLHFGCRLVVQFELPWTATRLEQRTGRVDRVGQTRRVHEALLVCRHTAERLVLAPLVKRVRVSASAEGVAPHAWTESDIAASLLEREALPDRQVLPSMPRRHPALEKEASIAARWLLKRRLLPQDGLHRSPAWVVATGDDTCSNDIVLVVRIGWETAEGHALGSDIAAFEGSLSLSSDSSDSVVNRVLEAWRCGLEQSLADAVGVSRSPVEQWIRVRDALARREQVISRCFGSPARWLLQPGLFDRRALDHVEEQTVARSELLEQSAVRLARLERGGDVRPRLSLAGIHVGRIRR